MAVDSKQKRFSILQLGSPVITVLPDADGSFTAPDRAELLKLYSGNALDSPPAPGGTTPFLFHMLLRRVRY